MPTTINEYVQTAQEQTLKSIRETQHAVVEAVKTWATAVEGSIPEIPTHPLADELPTPKDIIQTSFEFAEQLLKAQREFAESVLAASAPLFETKTPRKKTAVAA
jgi:hypothetical protein